MTYRQALLTYYNALSRPFRKITKLDFLQPDNSVAFSLSNRRAKSGYNGVADTKAFIQSGTLSVNLKNGQRRNADITLANIDDAFAYNVNNIWYGKQLRLQMGMELYDGKDFYFPQGVFYATNPQEMIKPSSDTISYDLVDKWAYLDGTLFGDLPDTMKVEQSNATSIFEVIQKILKLSRFDFDETENIQHMIDNVMPVFTSYYNDKTYTLDGGGTAPMLAVPYDIIIEAGKTLADLILELNDVVTGIIGYDMTGALRIDASQDDIKDGDKAILYEFTPENSTFCGVTETAQNQDVYNDVVVVGQDLTDNEIYGRATNFDAKSDTNVNIIGRKTYREEKAEYWNTTQCQDLAGYLLKQKTVLHKSVTVECSQMFHLYENGLISIKRTDKKGSPVEKHIIQSFSIPLAETGTMSISATSVTDEPIITTQN